MLTGDNSILKKSTQAKAYNIIGSVKDEVSLAYNAAYSDYMKQKYDGNHAADTTVTAEFTKEMDKILADESRKHGATIVYPAEGTEGNISKVTISAEANGETYSVTGTLTENGISSTFEWGDIEVTGTTPGGSNPGGNGGTGTNPVAVTGVTLSAGTTTLKMGGTVTTTVTATLSPSGATGTVTYTSSNTSVATIDSTGKVTAKSAGETTIKGTVNGVESNKIKITVQAADTQGTVLGTAENILKVDTTNHTTPYVEYNGNKYRVLYNNEHGVELISAGAIGTVTLGKNDPADLAGTSDAISTYKTNNNINIIGQPGSPGTLDRAKWSYNNAIATLNYAAEKCRVVGDGIADSARCVGSVPNNKFNKNTTKYSRSDSWFTPTYDNQFEQAEEVYDNSTGQITGTPNYTDDKTQLESLNIWNIGSGYWLASRSVYAFSDVTYFDVRDVYSIGDVDDYYLCRVNRNNGRAGVNYDSFGLRPVIHLASGVQVVSANGADGSSEDKAYTLKKAD